MWSFYVGYDITSTLVTQMRAGTILRNLAGERETVRWQQDSDCFSDFKLFPPFQLKVLELNQENSQTDRKKSQIRSFALNNTSLANYQSCWNLTHHSQIPQTCSHLLLLCRKTPQVNLVAKFRWYLFFSISIWLLRRKNERNGQFSIIEIVQTDCLGNLKVLMQDWKILKCVTNLHEKPL